MRAWSALSGLDVLKLLKSCRLSRGGKRDDMLLIAREGTRQKLIKSAGVLWIGVGRVQMDGYLVAT
jgi:hypothetical protein